MKNITIITLAFLLVSACSVANPKLSFGKKCVEKEGQILWSYVWLTDKPMVVDKHFCQQLK